MERTTNVRHGRSILLSMLSAAVVTTLAVTVSGAGGGATARAELLAISSKLDSRVSTVMIESSEPVAYVTSQPDPLTVVVDLRNVAAGVLAQPVGPLPPITGVHVEDVFGPDGGAVARVRVKLDRPSAHRVHSSRNFIYIDFTRDAAAAAAFSRPTGARNEGSFGAVPSAGSTGVRNGAAATSLRGVRALPGGAGVVITGNGDLIASSVQEARDLPHRVLLDFSNVSAGSAPAVTDVHQGDIERVRVGTNSRSPLVTRVVIDLARQLAYRVEEAGEDLRVLFGGDATEPTPPPAPQIIPDPAAPVAPITLDAPYAPDAPVAPVAPENRTAPGAPVAPVALDAPENRTAPVALVAPDALVAPEHRTAPGAPGAPLAPHAPGSAPAVSGQTTVQMPAQPDPTQVPPPQPDPTTRFRGTPVSLDFQGADLRAVLRTFAEISGLNIVIDPTIQGTVDVSLRDVPWDQALDIILKANKLGYSVDGTVVRIAPINVLSQEEEERRKLSEAQALAGDLRVLTVPLSYAKAPDLVAILTRSALSARGEVQVDARTNTLIVRDLPDRLTTAAELVKALDRPQPQVEIEARIVQTTRDFARSIGVQWGFNGRVDPALGNTTNLAFPNSGSITGRTGGVQGPVQGETAVDRGVNLGVGAATSAVGIALGSVNGALNLDVVLSALERSGRGRLLSTPRVSTQNNVEAEMTQGVEIPIQTVANNTVTVSFKPAALTLRVTPQITAANTVIMRVFLENASPDFSRQVNGIPPIDTQRAQTTVLVGDGETTVIGGIYLSREQATEGRVPLLHRIPLLGWLFRRDELSDESRELLIFITPRITRS
jgi:type IV pilus secretin PilQ/predicted competence protein